MKKDYKKEGYKTGEKARTLRKPASSDLRRAKRKEYYIKYFITLQQTLEKVQGDNCLNTGIHLVTDFIIHSYRKSFYIIQARQNRSVLKNIVQKN